VKESRSGRETKVLEGSGRSRVFSAVTHQSFVKNGYPLSGWVRDDNLSRNMAASYLTRGEFRGMAMGQSIDDGMLAPDR
jgi:hypothetical protein